MKPYSKQRRRYSNVTPVSNDLFTELPGSDDYSKLSDAPSSSSSSNGWNWGILTSLANTFGSVATSIWGKGGEWQASAYKSMYNQQKQTNTILWVVIGLVLALGVVLVIRKTK